MAYNLPLTPLYINYITVSEILGKFVWITYRIKETFAGLSPTCGQKSLGASSEDNTGKNMDN